MQKNLILVVILFTTLSSFSKSFDPDRKIITKKFGEYTVALSQEFESGLGKLTIKQREEKVFEESEIDNHYYFGNNFSDSSNNKDLYSGHDITGKGIPNLVISNWTGGAHCCHFLHIFELGKQFRKIATIEAHSSSVHFTDVDHDGFPEIEFWDGAIDYLFASFAGSPGGRVILKFQNEHYRVAAQIMKTPIPSAKQIKLFEKKITSAFKHEKSPELPYEFLNSMMDLSYTGHFELAVKMADEVWPKKKPGLAKFKSDFAKALHGSSYWKDLSVTQ